MLTRKELINCSDRELLIRLAQECSEVIKATTKWLLFGARPWAKGIQYNNVQDLREEFQQVERIMDELKHRHCELRSEP